jgi:Arc/MetJ family transcription regulator
MATNLALDDKLIDEAVRLGKHKSKKEAVTAALESYIRQQKRRGFRSLIGKVDFHDDFDHRALRRRRTA